MPIYYSFNMKKKKYIFSFNISITFNSCASFSYVAVLKLGAMEQSQSQAVIFRLLLQWWKTQAATILLVTLIECINNITINNVNVDVMCLLVQSSGTGKSYRVNKQTIIFAHINNALGICTEGIHYIYITVKLPI